MTCHVYLTHGQKRQNMKTWFAGYQETSVDGETGVRVKPSPAPCSSHNCSIWEEPSARKLFRPYDSVGISTIPIVKVCL